MRDIEVVRTIGKGLNLLYMDGPSRWERGMAPPSISMYGHLASTALTFHRIQDRYEEALKVPTNTDGKPSLTVLEDILKEWTWQAERAKKFFTEVLKDDNAAEFARIQQALFDWFLDLKNPDDPLGLGMEFLKKLAG